jgi:hypothetical protein
MLSPVDCKEYGKELPNHDLKHPKKRTMTKSVLLHKVPRVLRVLKVLQDSLNKETPHGVS